MKKVLLVGAVVLTMLSACSSRPQQPYGQGYEGQDGYYQPDHSWFYYNLAYYSTLGFYAPQPSYHVFVIPAGYPREYRPWQARDYARDSDGRFVRRPPVVVVPRSQSTGGYSQSAAPSAATGSRSKGGYAPPPPPSVAPSSRTTGGYASKAAPPKAPDSRSSGGYRSKSPSKGR